MTDGFNESLSEPPDGWYREKKQFYTIAVTYQDRTKDKVVSFDRTINVRQVMKDIIETNETIVSVRLINEPIGQTEDEYKREDGAIIYYGWSNCD